MNDKEKCIPECAYREKVTELQDENQKLRRGIRKILKVKRLWSSVVNPDHKIILAQVFVIVKQISE
ncbi:hypothetical protein LCGC14_0653530 [marine sediment metagenome]|uniref:Uncharacterized protein n=1 Tax=marine sediment metagenome TaxID=412755 RepID=A0A0F9THF0_9ZZZZ